MNIIEIKTLAKEKIQGNKWNIWQGCLVVIAVGIIFGFVQTLLGLDDGGVGSVIYNVIYSLAIAPLSVGLIKYCLDIERGKKFDLKDLFTSYKNIIPIIAVAILMYVIICIGFVLLIIPGIIASLALAMVYYIIADGEEDPVEAIKKSYYMTNGYKWNLCVLYLSFIGWIILACLTFGILFIWLYPYMIMTFTIYYDKLLELQKPVTEEVKESPKKKTTKKTTKK